MKCIIAIFFIVLSGLITGCTKNQEPLEPLEVPRDETKDFLLDVGSDSTAEYFISGEFDGRFIYMASTFASDFPYNDTIFNAIYTFPMQSGDNIHLLRRNADNTVQMAIYFSDAFLDLRWFPYEPFGFLDAGNGMAELEFINLKKLGTTGQNFPDDDFSFINHTTRSARVIVTSYNNHIMEGIFEGPIKTSTGSVIKLTNGKFRIRVVVMPQG